jgi:hypothetical protein
MATRGAIGIRNEDGSITGIYTHWDSYTSHNGRILLESYDHTKTRQLLELGAVSSLGKEIGEQHEFGATYKTDDPRYHWCTFYTRDRSDELWPAQTFANDKEFVKHFTDSWSAYFYLLEECGTWFVRTRSSKWQRVDQVLAMEAEENE